jgi:gas vesicle protein
MRRFLIGLLIVGAVIAAIAVFVKRRSGSQLDEWDSFAEDTVSRVPEAASEATESAKDAASEATEAAKDAIA